LVSLRLSLCWYLSLLVSVSVSLGQSLSVFLLRAVKPHCPIKPLQFPHPSPDRDGHDHTYRVTATLCPTALVIKVLTDPQYPYALSRLTQLANDSWGSETFQELIAAFPEETRKDAATLVAHVEDLTTKDIKAVYLKQLQGRPALSYSTIAQLL
jgi:hypothetical protein